MTSTRDTSVTCIGKDSFSKQRNGVISTGTRVRSCIYLFMDGYIPLNTAGKGEGQIIQTNSHNTVWKCLSHINTNIENDPS